MTLFFKSNLKLLRNKSGYTQEGLGLQMNKARNTINNWEKGVSEPNLSEVQKLCNLLDVDSNQLLFVDIADVHLSEKQKGVKNDKNVHLNVHPSVHLKGKTDLQPTETVQLTTGSEQAFRDALKTNDILGIAIKGLEAANARLIKEVEEKEQQIKDLKRAIPKVGGQVGGHRSKTAG